MEEEDGPSTMSEWESWSSPRTGWEESQPALEPESEGMLGRLLLRRTALREHLE